MKERPEIDLPTVGSVYAVRLKKGWWGACWIVRRGKPGLGSSHLGPFVVVASADWFGREPPTLQQLRTPKLLRIDHEGYNEPAVFNVNEPVSRGVALVGSLEAPIKVGSAPWVAGWPRVAALMDLQRVWNVDRAASAAAYEAKQARWAKRNEREAAEKKKTEAARRAVLTIGKLRKATLLRAWEGAMPAARVTEGRKLLATLLDTLETHAGDSKKQLAALRTSVVSFNRWNDKHGVIETAEREALYETLIEIGAAARLAQASDAIEDVRDW